MRAQPYDLNRHRRNCGALFLGALVMLSTLASPPLNAQENAGASALGRLFFSAQQRQEFDRRRELNIQEATVVVVESLYTVNGHISRSSGKSTTWVNGAAQNDAYGTRDPASILLQPVQDEPPVSLKVGQTLDRTSGTIKNVMTRGEIKIKPGAAPERR